MTVEELIQKLNRGIRVGSIQESDEILVRDTSVSDDAMEAGSNGYKDLDEVLIPRDGTVRFLIEEY